MLDELRQKNSCAVFARAALVVLLASPAYSQVWGLDTAGQITTIAGNGASAWSGDGAAATAAGVGPIGVAVDANWNLFIADGPNNRVRRVDRITRVITTVAGGATQGSAGDGGAATSAQLNSPAGVALDAAGNLFIADTGNCRIRKVAAGTGVITTLAGAAGCGLYGDSGPAVFSQLSLPQGVTVDSTGIVYVADTGNHVIRRIDGNGIISTVAGSSGSGFAGDGGLGTAALLNQPAAVVSDASGNLFIADTGNGRIRKVSATTGIISTLTAATTAGLAIDEQGSLYCTDSVGNLVRRINVGTGTLTTIAGSGGAGWSGDGGTATLSQVGSPRGLAVDSGGNLYVSQIAASRVRFVLTNSAGPTPQTITFAQPADQYLPAAALVLSASASSGLAVAFTSSTPFVCTVAASTVTFLSGGACSVTASQSGNNSFAAATPVTRALSVYRVGPAWGMTTTGQITTIAGSASAGYSGDGGAATAAQFGQPVAVALDHSGNLYIADLAHNVVRKVVASTGVVQTVAGTGTAGFSGDGGLATAARLSAPTGIALDTLDNLYIADSLNHRIRKITAGVISTVAGAGGNGYAGDGGPAIGAVLNQPAAVATDAAGNVYIADMLNHRVRKVTLATGVISTVAGTGSAGTSGDGGQGVSALLNLPRALAVDSAGNIFVADNGSRVRKVANATGIITTVAGTTATGFSGDGGQATFALLTSPAGIAFDAAGNLYISESGNARVRRVSAAAGVINTVAGSGIAMAYPYGDGGIAVDASLGSADSIAIDTAGNLFIGDGAHSNVRFVLGASQMQTQTLSFPAIANTSFLSVVNVTATASSGVAAQFVSQTPSVCSVTGSSVTFTVRGLCTVAAYQAGTAVWGAVGPISQTFTGLGTAQTITFAAIANQNAYSNLPLAASSTSGLAVAFATDTQSSACQIVSGVLQLSSGGQVCTVTASQNGNASYEPAPPVTRAFVVLPNWVTSSVSEIVTIAGTGTSGTGGDGASGVAAFVNQPGGVAVDAVGDVYIADTSNHRIRKLTGNGTIAALAGNGTAGFSGDGAVATAACLSAPQGVAVDTAGNVYIADTGNHRIRQVAVNGVITTVAGTGSAGYSGDGAQAVSAALSGPVGVAVDAAGNLFVADAGNGAVRRIDAVDHTIGTVALADVSGGIAIDGTGNIYLGGATQVRKILSGTNSAVVIAGTGSSGFGGDGGTASAALFNGPLGVAVDTTGNLVIADSRNHRVRGISASTGLVATLAGTGTGGYNGDGDAFASQLKQPQGVAVDIAGDVVIADTLNQRVRFVRQPGLGRLGQSITFIAVGAQPSGAIVSLSATASSGLSVSYSTSGSAGVCSVNGSVLTTLGVGSCVVVASQAGSSTYAPAYSITQTIPVQLGSQVITFPSIADQYLGTPVALVLSSNSGLTADAASTTQNCFVRNTQGTLAVITTAPGTCNIVATQAGDAQWAPATATRSFNVTVALTTAPFWGMSVPGTITTLLGNGQAPIAASGDGAAAMLSSTTGPLRVAVDSQGNVYVSDSNQTVRAINASTGVVTTLAGPGNAGNGLGDGGPANLAWLAGPRGMAFDSPGNLYFADTPIGGGAGRIRKVAKLTGAITTVAGSGEASYNGEGIAATAAGMSPSGVALDAAGNIYLADTGNHRVRRISVSTGLITTIAGTGISGYSGDGGSGTTAKLNGPQDVVVDSAGNVCVADTGNHAIRKIAANGVISSLAGTGIAGFSGDGSAAVFGQLNSPFSLTLDVAGNLYIADSGNQRLRVILAASGNLSTMAGTGVVGYLGDPGSSAAAAQLNGPQGIAVDGLGNAYISDTGNQRVRYVYFGSSQPDLVIAATHTGNWTQGQTGSGFNLTVSNAGMAATTASVSVTASLPSGLTAASIGGTGWTCTLASLSCTRSDVLSAGGSYPAISISVNVGASAPGVVVNSAIVAGGGESNVANDTASDSATILATQTITFLALADQTLAAVPFPVTASATSGLMVQFASNSPGVCTVSGSTVTLVSAGICSLTASQPGNGVYAAALPVRQTFSVNLRPQTITFGNPGAVAFGSVVVLSATATSGLAVSFVSNTAAVCTVAGTSVTLIASGSCSITASQGGDASYQAAPAVMQVFAVNLAAQMITFANPGTASFGSTVVLAATASSGLAVSFTSNSTGICTVSGNTVTLVSTGNCSVTANQPGNANYSAAPAITQVFAVNPAAQTITFTNPGTAAFASVVALTATASSGLAVSFASNSTGICTVSGNTVTLVSTGNCSVTANQPGNANYSAAPAITQVFTVNPAAQTITFTNPGTAAFASVVALTATASSGLAVSFTSNSTGICTVSGNNVTLVSTGNCSITANQAGNANYAAAPQITQVFTINPAAQTITFANPGTVTFGSVVPLTATASSGLAVSFTSNSTGICTVSGNNVTLVSTGNCSVTANQPGNPNYAAAPPITQVFAVNPAVQTITFTNPGTAAFASVVALTATASSGLAVSFTSNSTGICTVSGNNVTLVSTGNCSVTANQPGNPNYAAAPPITQVFAVNLAAQTITFANPGTATFGTAVVLAATATSGLIVSFTSNSPGTCTVSGNNVTLVSTGNCSVSANQAGDANYSAAPAITHVFTVNPAAQTTTFMSPGTVTVGSIVALTATASSGLAVSFTSNSTGICTVSGNNVTLVSTGNCSVTANQPGNPNYAAAPPITQVFAVNLAAQTITFANPGTATFGTAVVLAATATSGLIVSFTSNSPGTCTVSGNIVTLVSTGNCSVSANQAGDANYSAAPAITHVFTVNPAAQTTTFTNPGAAPFGSVLSLTATASSGLAVSFTSNSTGVCTVSGNNVTLVSTGNCSITANQAGNANYAAAPQITQVFTINPAAQTITFANSGTATFGSAVALIATASSGLVVSLTSNSTGVCTVSGNIATLVSTGNCSVTASQAGNANYSAAPEVTQVFAVSMASQAIIFANPGYATFGSVAALTATASSGLTVAFASNSTGICTVSGTSVTFVSTGSCSITANQPGNAYYSAAPAVTQVFSVSAASQSIAFANPGTATFGTSSALTGTATSGLPVSFSSSTPAVCTVTGTSVTLIATGNCSITASQAGDAQHAGAVPVMQTFAVNPSPQSISFQNPGPATAGTASALSATATSGLTIAFTSNTPAICTVSGASVTPLAAGNCSITASQTGNGNYALATPVTQSFSVNAASQTITFDQPLNQMMGATPFPLTATASSGLVVALASATPSVCTVTGALVTLVAPGICSITATQPGNATYAAASVTRDFVVSPPSCTISLDRNNVDLTVVGGAFHVAVGGSTAGCNFTSTVSDSANLTISPGSGVAPADLTVTVHASSFGDRTLTATIGGQLLTIRQSGHCSVNLDSSGAAIAAIGGTGSIGITTQIGCIYSVSIPPSWIAITSGVSGAGPTGTLTFSATPNSTTASRAATLSIGGRPFQITQQGLPCEVSLETTALASPFTAAGSGGSIAIVAGPACSWSASTDTPWITLDSPTSGTGPASVSVRTTPNVAATARPGQIMIAGQMVQVSQAGQTCDYTLRSTTGSFAAAGGAGSAGVVTAANCAWTANSNAPWLGVATANPSGTGEAQFTAAANPSGMARTGTLTVAGQTFTVTQAGAPCSFTLNVAAVSLPTTALANSTFSMTTTTQGCAATAVSYNDWVHVSTVLRGLTGTVTYSVDSNGSGSARSGVVKAGDQTFAISQAAGTCSYTLASTSSAYTQAGGTGIIRITASGPGCVPSISNGQPAFVVLDPLSGPLVNVYTQSYTVPVFSSQAGAARIVRIGVGTGQYTIKQTPW